MRFLSSVRRRRLMVAPLLTGLFVVTTVQLASAPSDTAAAWPLERHRGVDSCANESVSRMSVLYRNSPYGTYGFYVGGLTVNRSCPYHASFHTKAWADAVKAQGWNLQPIYSGRQPGCHPNVSPYYKISTDPATAYAQGRSEGTDAMNQAAARGITGPLWVDVDVDIPNSYSCRPSVDNYIKGWTSIVAASGREVRRQPLHRLLEREPGSDVPRVQPSPASHHRPLERYSWRVQRLAESQLQLLDLPPAWPSVPRPAHRDLGRIDVLRRQRLLRPVRARVYDAQPLLPLHPMTGSRWGRVGLAAACAIAVLLAARLAVSGFGQDSAEDQAVGTARPTGPACRAGELTGRAEDRGSLMSNTKTQVTLTNAGSRTCALAGAVTVYGVRADGSSTRLASTTGTYFGDPPPIGVPITPGETAAVYLSGGRGCDAAIEGRGQTWDAIRVELPEGGGAIDVRTDFDTACGIAVSALGQPDPGTDRR